MEMCLRKPLNTDDIHTISQPYGATVAFLNQEPCLNLTSMGQMRSQTLWRTSTVLVLCTPP